MRDFLLLLIVFGAVPLTLIRPQIGILMWFWISLMNPHRLTWSYAYDLRVALVVAITTLVAWVLSREPKRPPGMPLTYALAAFTFWISFSTIFAIVPNEAFQKWQEIIKILGMSFLTTCLVQTRDRIQQLVWIIAISIGFYGLRGGVFSVLTGGNYRIYGPPDSFIEDNNQLALALTMSLPLLQYLSLITRQRWMRLGLLGTIGLTIISILCSYSRGGFLALCITLPVLWLKSRHRILVGVITLGALAGGLFWLPEAWFERMRTITEYEYDASAQGRLHAWKFALELAADHPFVGGGLEVIDDANTYKHYFPNETAFRNFHSIYFQVLGESGYVGLGLFVVLIVTSLLTARSIIRAARVRTDLSWAGQLAASIQVSIVGFCVAGGFVNLGFYDLYYVLVAVLISTRLVVSRALAVSGRAPLRRRAHGHSGTQPDTVPAAHPLLPER